MSLLQNGARCALRTAVVCGLASLGLTPLASAKTLCVNPAGSSGCSTTIGAAVAAASPGDTINIGAGVYTEGVVINKQLSLVGAGTQFTIINASGKANGIYVDGVDNGGLSNVLITGITVMNANFEGILLTNTNSSVISNNRIANNDQALNYTSGTCPNQPAFETSEGDDCGEGLHLMGTYGVTVANNEVELNSGGILISDETGEAGENIITGNSVHDNTLDCGVTLASHPPSPSAASKLPYGVVSNNVVGNQILDNGTIGSGAGVGIFAPAPGNITIENKVIGNTIMGNGASGVAMHNHALVPNAPGVDFNGNVVMGNYISGNGPDNGDAATPGPVGINLFSVAPVYGDQILDNTIVNEAYGVVLHAPGGNSVHLNNLPAGAVGLDNLGTGTVDATMNYFGCATGPGASGSGTTGTCASVSGNAINSSPWMSMPVSNAPSSPVGTQPQQQ